VEGLRRADRRQSGVFLNLRLPPCLVPVGEDFFSFLDFFFLTGEGKADFSGPAGDEDFDGGQTIPLHAQVELFMGLLDTVVLETMHGLA
jgi:hypothetical protein